MSRDFPPPLLRLPQCQNNTFGIYWISCILVFLNSRERSAELWQGEKWVILWWALWFIIRCFSAKCTKGVSLFYFFSFFPLDSVMMMYVRNYFPAQTWNWHRKPCSTLFSGPFFFFFFFSWWCRLKENVLRRCQGGIFRSIASSGKMSQDLCVLLLLFRGDLISSCIQCGAGRKTIFWHVWIQRRNNAAGVFK